MSGNDPEHQAVTLSYFGCDVTPIRFADWCTALDAKLTAGVRGYRVAHHNLHSLYVLHRDDTVRAFYTDSDECYIDGMPVRLILAGMGIQTTPAQRFTLMDRFEGLLRYAQEHDWTLYYVGSSEEVVTLAREKLARDYPKLDINLAHGFASDWSECLNDIKAHRPDILLVGMGMPLQERWLSSHAGELDVGIAMQAGATLDYFVGAQARPPIWMSNLGLGWLYRLLADPARLARRYLLEPWALLLPTLRLCWQYRAHSKSQNTP